MSTGRSPSGVASLRARFEQNTESESPPSRGRSPTSSVISETSRPLSKVRTSFVSVEPSGRMAEQSGAVKEGAQNMGADGADESRLDPNGTPSGKSTRINGTKPSPDPSNTTTGAQGLRTSMAGKNVPSQNTKPVGGGHTANPSRDDVTGVAGGPTKMISVLKGGDSGKEPGDVKSLDNTPGLGSILKGSPFEEKEAPQQSGVGASDIAVKNSDPITPGVSSTKSSASIGKPKEPQAESRVMPSSSVPAHSGATKPKQKPATSQRETSVPQQTSAVQPNNSGAASTKKSESNSKNESRVTLDKPVVPSASKGAVAAGKGPKISPTSATPSEQTGAVKGASVKAPVLSKPEASKGSAPKGSVQSSSTSKSPIKHTTAAKKTLDKKPGPSSPPFSKPKPKSPTRPVKLPNHLTAPTASSAAKHEDDTQKAIARPSSRSSRVSLASMPAPNPTHLKPASRKPPRASMPAPGAAHKVADRIRPPRQSMASSKPSSGNFLERMMRPTASSAQKTHEKVEAKTSPPRKVPGSRVASMEKPPPKRPNGVTKAEATGDAGPDTRNAKPESSNGCSQPESKEEAKSAPHETAESDKSQEARELQAKPSEPATNVEAASKPAIVDMQQTF